MNDMTGAPVEILVVEDNPGDIELLREALGEAKVINKLHVVNDGEEALAFLKRRGKYKDASCPDLIMLDLNLPGYSGREVLEEIKNDSELGIIPVIVLTSSEAEEDILRSYKLHANSYITKPVDYAQFMRVIRSFEDFWLSVVKLPPRTC